MTDPEDQDAGLLAMSDDLAQALDCAWEPRVVARAFGTRRSTELAFTMQVWIDLERVRSPLLVGEPLVDRADLELAMDAFGLALGAATPEEAAVLAAEMMVAVHEGFGMALTMRPQGETGEPEPDGLGRWLPLWAALVSQVGLSPAEAKAMAVGEAMALLAAHRRNEGWKIAGVAYALRNLEVGTPNKEGQSDE